MKTLIIVVVSALIGSSSVSAADPNKSTAKPAAAPRPATAPEASGKWTVDDAQKFLSSLSGKGAADLPKYADKQSPLKKTVDSVDDMTGGADIRARMTNLSKTLTVLGTITSRYSNAAAQGHNYDEEILYLVCASMKTSSLTVKSLEKYVATLNENEPTYHQSLANIERMKSSAAQQLLTMCMTIEARGDISDQLRLVACKYLIDYGAPIVANTPETLKPGVKIKYQQLIDSETNPEIKLQLTKFLSCFGS